MSYFYIVLDGNSYAGLLTTLEKVESFIADFSEPKRLSFIALNAESGQITALHSPADREAFREGLERSTAWSSKAYKIAPTLPASIPITSIDKAVTPKHYKSYIDCYEWIDAMARIPSLRAPEKFKAGVEMQIRKYLDRNGSKDSEVQELRKALFYMMYLVMFVENDEKPILAKDVHQRLAK